MKQRINLFTSNAARWKVTAAVAIFVLLFALPLFIDNDYVKHLLIMACIAASLGMTFSLLYSTGLITLGAASFYALGAYISTMLAVNLNVAFWFALPLTIAASAVLAFGLGAVFVRNAGVAFVIITLIFAQVVVIAMGQLEIFGGWGGIMGIPRPTSLWLIEFTGKTSFYYLILTMLLAVCVIYYALYTSRIGRVWKSIKLSPSLAGTLGINPYRYRLLAFVIGSATAAAIGSFYAHYSQAITPNTFGGWSSIYVQLYAVLGGLGFYILGPAVGAIIMTFVPEYLRVIKEAEPIITGLLLLVIILFIPGGILGTARSLYSFAIRKLGTAMRVAKRANDASEGKDEY